MLRAMYAAKARRSSPKALSPRAVSGDLCGRARLGLFVDLTIEIAELEWENSRAQFYGELLPPASAREDENSLLNLPQ